MLFGCISYTYYREGKLKNKKPTTTKRGVPVGRREQDLCREWTGLKARLLDPTQPFGDYGGRAKATERYKHLTQLIRTFRLPEE